MSPSPFQDIVPPERRSIRNITPTHARTRTRPPSENDLMEEPPFAEPPRKRKPRKKLMLFGGGALLLLIILLAFSFFLTGSRVVVVPKQKDVALEGTFDAKKDAEGSDTLGYQLMTHSKSVSKSVTASGEETVNERASGTIIIFNDFSSTPQRLIKNTRFETPTGLIYRIADSVTVPGQKTNGGQTVPGSAEARVFADKAGEEYNSGPTDFTIPGFKGDPRYEKFYARSKTPMEGGFSGTRPAVDSATLAKATAELEQQVTEELKKEAKELIPEGHYLFDDMMFVVYEPPKTAPKGGQAELSLTGTIHGILFDRTEFASFVASQTVSEYDGESVRLDSVATLKLAPVLSPTDRPWESEMLQFTASGTAHLIWEFSEENLKNDLTGRPKAALPTILSGYNSIEKAEVILRPFWRQTFPEDANEISVEVELET